MNRTVIGTAFSLSLLVVSTAAGGQEIRIEPEPVECLPIGGNGVAWARVENNRPDATVRLYFRRLHDVVEDLYYVEMRPAGADRYWGVFPKAEDRMLDRHDLEAEREELQGEEEASWAAWWRAKELSETRDPNQDLDRELIRERASLGKTEERHWMLELDDVEFEGWLEGLQNEPAEYFVAVHDPGGARLARSETRVAEVRGDCEVTMTPQQAGEAENLVIGETASWQKGEEVFHWMCDGIVTRIDPLGILRADERCRVCVIAWWQRPEILVPEVVGGTIAIGIVLNDGDDEIVSEPELDDIGISQ